MAFNSYEELKAAVADRRQAILTLEVDLGGKYSQEYEDAKKALATAKGLKQLAEAGGGAFLADNLEALEARVAAAKPESNSIWLQYRQIDLAEWTALTKQANLTAVEQYEKVLPSTFIGLYGADPAPDEKPEGWVTPEPLTTDPRSASTRGGPDAILSGPTVHSVVNSFMAWQNSGGEVSIRPTRSGLA